MVQVVLSGHTTSEFFSQCRVSRLNLLCFPHQTRGEGKWAKRDKNGTSTSAGKTTEDMFVSSQSSNHLQWKQDCLQDNIDELDSVLDHTQGEVYLAMNWFRCETDKNGDLNGENHSSLNIALKSYLELSVELLLNESETLNLTLYSHSYHSFLHLHPPEEEDAADADDKGQREAFFCCPTLLPTHKSANQSCCLLGLTNHTILTPMEKLPWKRTHKDEWQCLFRIVWLILLLVVLLIILIIVVRQVYKGLYPNRRQPSSHLVRYEFPVLHLKGPEKQMNGRQRSLSTIQEVDRQYDGETLSNGNMDDCFSDSSRSMVRDSVLN
ncbi:uncharacterized protein LOC114464665 isoform X2 [Gouania willdenowi]|uniref:uncharacterized protein LOC114464665 isoform X2 n=1 Tax=Gouania willdenowi TaxID=441366 RepID=UPI001055E271|nr:uncharacterized protein LOC114464665 isoform X2 [Gouania willdenowi]